jgi:hypothetical protein
MCKGAPKSFNPLIRYHPNTFAPGRQVVVAQIEHTARDQARGVGSDDPAPGRTTSSKASTWLRQAR